MMRRRLHGRRGLKYFGCNFNLQIRRTSPPSRAAWIEILRSGFVYMSEDGRRLHGRRGLKSDFGDFPAEPVLSPPSRAAWIEMLSLAEQKRGYGVAAFTGGVD